MSLAVIVLQCLLVLSCLENPSLSEVDYKRTIEIAASQDLVGASTLQLTCKSADRVWLVLITELPLEDRLKIEGSKSKATLYLHKLSSAFDITMVLSKDQGKDVLVGILTSTQINILESNDGQIIDLLTLETGTYMRRKAEGSDIRAFIAMCNLAQ